MNFEEILDNNKDRIYRICRAYATNPIEPEDLFQEVASHLWKAFQSFENRSDISTWVYRITLNVCMRYKSMLEKRNGERILLESIEFEVSAEQGDEDQREKHEALLSCIHSLDEVNRSLVILFLDDLSYRDIAKITGLTENHIAVKMKRIRKMLSNCIKPKLR